MDRKPIPGSEIWLLRSLGSGPQKSPLYQLHPGCRRIGMAQCAFEKGKCRMHQEQMLLTAMDVHLDNTPFSMLCDLNPCRCEEDYCQRMDVQTQPRSLLIFLSTVASLLFSALLFASLLYFTLSHSQHYWVSLYTTSTVVNMSDTTSTIKR
jgi:hypothetical protein